VIRAGDITIDLVGRTVVRKEILVHLTPTEWEVLKALAARPNRTLTHQQIFNAAWRGRTHGDPQAHLRVHVTHLRRKLEDDPVRPRHILTEPGVGYRFQL
jgi:two-component system KDP operon response regulator KdpE